MALVRQQKLLSFTAGLAVAGASYVSTQVRTWLSCISVYMIVWLTFGSGILSLYGTSAKVICCAEIDMVVNVSPGR
jgi:hypothetical protein